VELKDISLYAWMGEDELGSGEIGLKQAQCPAGMIPMVSIERRKIDQDYIREQMQRMANVYGTNPKLCEFVYKQTLDTLLPEEPTKECSREFKNKIIDMVLSYTDNLQKDLNNNRETNIFFLRLLQKAVGELLRRQHNDKST